MLKSRDRATSATQVRARQGIIRGALNAQGSGAVACQLVNTPAWGAKDALGVRRQDKSCHHPPDSGFEVAAHAAGIIIFK
jgi:hypothetical protein